jgi:endonuclease YncB( thermonuclease family)
MRLALIAIVLALAAPALAQDLAGPARVIDGDTLEVAGQRIRIHGIDAPEARQLCSTGTEQTACGQRATQEM